MKPLVSVCIPTFNRSNKLTRAVESLLNSSYTNIEIIISDNASDDQTPIVCKELTTKDNRIKYFRHCCNMGPVANFEFARRSAIGKYFMWHNDDDFLDRCYIEKCVQQMEIDKSLVAYSGIGKYIYKNGDVSHYGNIVNCNYSNSILRITKYVWNVGENSIFYGVFRKSLVEDIRFPNIVAVDWAWMIAVLMKGRVVVDKSLHISREFEFTTSSSPRSMVLTQGLPAWYQYFPWLAHLLALTKYVRNDIYELKSGSPIKQFSNLLAIQILLCLKCVKMSIVTKVERIPHLKTFYRRHLKRKFQF